MVIACTFYETALFVPVMGERKAPLGLRSYRYGSQPQGFHVQVDAPVEGTAFSYHLPQDFTSGLRQHGIDKKVLFPQCFRQ